MTAPRGGPGATPAGVIGRVVGRGALALPDLFPAFFALFLFAGVAKPLARLAWVPIDLTLVTLLGSLATSWLGVRTGRWTLPRAAAGGLLAMSALAVWCVVTLAWSPGGDYAGRKAMLFVLLGTWSFAGGVLAGRTTRRQNRFLATVVFLAVWLALEVQVSTFAGGAAADRIWNQSYIGYGRLFCYGAIVLSAQMMAPGAGRLATAVRAVLAAAVLGGLLVGGARGPALAFACGMGVLFGGRVRLGSGSIAVGRRAALVLAMAATGLAVLLIAGGGPLLRTLDRLAVFLGEEGGRSVGQRLFFWRHAVDLWAQAPWLGHGVGSWPILMGWGDIRAYPHNIILELAVECGALGLALFALVVASATRDLASLANRDGASTMVAALVVAALVNSLFSGDLTDNRVLFALLGMAAAGPPVESA